MQANDFPAFPTGSFDEQIPGDGLSIRDYFAIRAPEPTKDRMDLERMKDRNRNPHNDSYKPPIRSDMEIRCALAYEYASAMLKAREAC
jgi:hypothetical protein